MFRRRADPNSTPQLLLLIGQLLAIINETQPIPESPNWFIEEIGKLQALTTQRAVAQNLQKIALIIQMALRRSSYAEVNGALWKAIFHLQKMAGTSKTGIIIDDHQLIGKQVVSRQQKKNTIIYGHITSTLVFPNGSTVSDTWVVKVQPGFYRQAESNVFVLYNGPQLQAGEHVWYVEREQHIAATILGPGFGMRGCFGFNLSFQKGGKEDYRYAVPYTDLSYDV